MGTTVQFPVLPFDRMVRDIIRAKVALVGDDKIGKTKLLNAFMNGASADGSVSPVWSSNYVMTIEMDLQTVSINIPDSNFCVELQIFDFGGSALFNADSKLSARRKFLTLCDYVLAAYSVADRASFDSLKNGWLSEFRATHSLKNAKAKASNGVLLGLQSDLEEFAAVNRIDAIKLAKEHSLAAIECSAKRARDVDTPFNFIAQQSFLRHSQNHKEKEKAQIE